MEPGSDVTTHGPGEPEVAVVGGVHGDEPSGVRAVERLRRAIERGELDLRRGLALVVANPAAVEAGVRYLDADLNRSFPGDPASELHEERLAAELVAAVGDCTTLALHSTRSYGGMFALVDTIGDLEREVCPRLPIDAVIETHGANEGRIFAAIPATIEVECGYQGSPEAAANAEQVIREFLAALAVTDEPAPVRTPSLPVFQLGGPIPKDAADDYEVFVRNFEPVAAGDPVAAADGETLHAEEAFHPVLLSAEGYEDVFGYMGDHVGTLE